MVHGKVGTLAVLAMAFVGTGCGATTTTTTVGASGPVTLVVTSPTSGSVINADSVTVRGTVNPTNATVQVQGNPAAVGNGIFTGNASLHSGRTTIDVIASAPGSAPASTSITITRASQGGAQSQPSGGSQGQSAAPAAPPDVAHAQPGSSGGQTSCGGGLSVGPSTTCAFAGNVEAAYRSNGPGTVTVYSPVTDKTYYMNCQNNGGQVTCTGGNNASVYFSG